MSSLRQRLKALQRGQDAKCEACWDAYMAALLKCEPALKRCGVPADLAERWFEEMTADEVATVEAALLHMPDEVEAVERTYARVTQIEAMCEAWLRRRAVANERVLAQHAAGDLTTSP